MSDTNSRDAVLAAWACGIADKVIPIGDGKPNGERIRGAVQRAKLVGVLMWAATQSTDTQKIEAVVKHVEEIRPLP